MPDNVNWPPTSDVALRVVPSIPTEANSIGCWLDLSIMVPDNVPSFCPCAAETKKKQNDKSKKRILKILDR